MKNNLKSNYQRINACQTVFYVLNSTVNLNSTRIKKWVKHDNCVYTARNETNRLFAVFNNKTKKIAVNLNNAADMQCHIIIVWFSMKKINRN